MKITVYYFMTRVYCGNVEQSILYGSKALRDAAMEVAEKSNNYDLVWGVSEDVNVEDHPVISAAAPLIDFINKLDAKPLKGICDDFYNIHMGSEWAASLRNSDLRKLREAINGGEA